MKGDKQPRERGSKDRIQGEGDYEAGRRYDKATRDFVDAGKVDEAAEAAAPDSATEADELRRAEREGRAHSKGESTGQPTDEPPGVEPRS